MCINKELDERFFSKKTTKKDLNFPNTVDIIYLSNMVKSEELY